MLLSKRGWDGRTVIEGFILDGYPRTIHQADFLHSLCEKDGTEIRTIGIEVEDRELIKRLSSRWTCPKCGKIFNSTLNTGMANGQCDTCHTALVQRKDDMAEVIEERLRVYKKQTAPLVQYYRNRGLYVELVEIGQSKRCLILLWTKS